MILIKYKSYASRKIREIVLYPNPRPFCLEYHLDDVLFCIYAQLDEQIIIFPREVIEIKNLGSDSEENELAKYIRTQVEIAQNKEENKKRRL